ncbi:penicillin-binding transpeptidase domain-containing protein [Legionella londiniensis]|uniref:Beta-lactamase n=1 Tax=Legionella londiniensis TaxID=45068 RepID=A0A0W0VQL9_9GAMM|nr:penicillin-binding transpeptidase domain-containing protein [Legionella londiniensis]KTD22360.1 class-D beta-lactamase [Legionella londiniensis]STX93066.1 class-D beta-lactamase [Legionella londiniensis]
MKFLSMCIIVMLNHVVSAQTIDSYMADKFKEYDVCFILYSLNQNKILLHHNPNERCKQRIAPDSTFKIALSLMAFDQKVITRQTVFLWDGKQRELPAWNQNQNPRSWLENSAVWVSQEITPKLGLANIKQYLADFNYGNQDFTGDPGLNNGLSRAWLSSSLKISANEQLEFIKNMLTGKLPVSNQALINTEQNMYLGRIKNGAALFGKTGSGIHKADLTTDDHTLRDGWFIGFIENGTQKYIFVGNLTDKYPPHKEQNQFAGSQILKPLVLEVLNNYFLNHES